MTIKVVRSILRNSGGSLIPIGIAVPFMALLAMLPLSVLEENPDIMDQPTTLLFIALPFIIMIPIIPMFTRNNAMQIIKTANIEKRMERLKKLGADEFIKQTKAELVDVSHRGNYLYKTSSVIKNRTLKFLVYKDISTDRQYISFVRDNLMNADEAMASKFSLSDTEYGLLNRRNEA